MSETKEYKELIGLVTGVIEAQKESNIQIAHLAKSIDKLVTVEAVRSEKDKHQEEKNKSYDDFVNESRPIIARAKLTQEMWDKAKGPLLVFFIIGFLTMAGVNFAG